MEAVCGKEGATEEIEVVGGLYCTVCAGGLAGVVYAGWVLVGKEEGMGVGDVSPPVCGVEAAADAGVWG